MTAVDWGRLLDGLDDPPLGTVAEALADATDTSVSAAYDRVEDALENDDAPPVEKDTGEAFPKVHLAAGADDPKPDERGRADDAGAAEGETWGSNPTPKGDFSGSTPPLDGEIAESWEDVAWETPTPDTYLPAQLKREQWMGRKGKLPFAPWGDRDAPLECSHSTCPSHDAESDPEAVAECPDCRAHREGTTTAECDHDARCKWGHATHYRDGVTVEIAEDDPRLDGRAFIQQEDDPFLFVDGDDVRCPETGDVHPEFTAILERLGLTYADISGSDAGSHPTYEGELPNGQSQAVFDIDDDRGGRTTTRRRSRYTPENTCASPPVSTSPGRPWRHDRSTPTASATSSTSTTH